MKKVFLVSLYNTIAEQQSIIGFLFDNNKEIIANYIKNEYNFVLQDQVQNEFAFNDSCHWEYTTDVSSIKVCVDLCRNLNEHENK